MATHMLGIATLEIVLLKVASKEPSDGLEGTTRVFINPAGLASSLMIECSR
jgi:hypothetical protein